MVLELQEVIALSEAFLVSAGRLSGLLRQVLHDIPLHFPCQAGGQGDQPLVVAVQDFHVHTGAVVVALGEAFADDLHQVGVAGVVLRQQDKVVVPVLAAGGLLVEAGVRGHIDLAADDGIDASLFGGPVEVDDTVHDAVVRDGGAVHAQLFYTGDVFFDFIGAVQEGVFRVDVKVCECHVGLLCVLIAFPVSLSRSYGACRHRPCHNLCPLPISRPHILPAPGCNACPLSAVWPH